MSTPEMVLAGRASAATRRDERGPRKRVARGTVAMLREVPLFEGLSSRHVRRIAQLATEVTFRAGRTIVERGVRGDAFYLILDGRAKVYRSVVPGGRILARLGPGDFFGEMALLDGGPRAATVVAETPLAAMRLSRPAFRRLLQKEPAVAVRVLEEMARRSREHQPAARQ